MHTYMHSYQLDAHTHVACVDPDGPPLTTAPGLLHIAWHTSMALMHWRGSHAAGLAPPLSAASLAANTRASLAADNAWLALHVAAGWPHCAFRHQQTHRRGRHAHTPQRSHPPPHAMHTICTPSRPLKRSQEWHVSHLAAAASLSCTQHGLMLTGQSLVTAHSCHLQTS